MKRKCPRYIPRDLSSVAVVLIQIICRRRGRVTDNKMSRRNVLEVSDNSNFQSCLSYVLQEMNRFIPCIRLDVCRNVVRAAVIQPSKKPPLEQSSCRKGSSCFHVFEMASWPSKLEAAGTLLISSQMLTSGYSQVEYAMIFKLCDVCWKTGGTQSYASVFK